MSYILLDGNQIHVDNKKDVRVLKISISNQLDVVLSIQAIIFHEDMVTDKGVSVIFDSEKRYKFFVEDVDYSKDGSTHYIEYKSLAWNKKDGLFIDKTRPIYSSPTWPESIIIWYKGTIVGKCIRKWAYLTYNTQEQCNWFLRSEKFGIYELNCLHLMVSPEFSIPINWFYETLWGIQEWKRYVFECQFGYDGWWGDPGYPQYAEHFYISWLITDTDLEPK